MQKRIVIAIVAVTLVTSFVLWKGISERAADSRLTISGTIEADEIQLGSRIGGRILEVLVTEGSKVAPGQPIVRFEAADLPARRAEAMASIARAEAVLAKARNGSRAEEIAEVRAQAATARARLEEARNGPRTAEINQVQADLQAAEADLEVAIASYKRIESLENQGVVPRQSLDDAKATLDRARGRRDSVRERVNLLQEGTRDEQIAQAEGEYSRTIARQHLFEKGSRPEEIAEVRAELDRARAGLARIEADLAELEITAPSAAFVEVLQIRPGDFIGPGAPIATLVEIDRLWVRVYVPEPELGRLHLGDPVDIRVDTFPNEAFAGRIEHISSRGEFTPRNVQTREERDHQVFAIRIRLDTAAGRLRAGMAADARL